MRVNRKNPFGFMQISHRSYPPQVAPPRVKESALHMECQLVHTFDVVNRLTVWGNALYPVVVHVVTPCWYLHRFRPIVAPHYVARTATLG